ncbi:MAG: N-6 DNA methylase [Oscillospiraceae bacterium]
MNIKKKLLREFNLHTIVRLPGSVFSPYTSITTNILFFDNTQPTEETWFYRLDMPEGYKHFSKTKPMKLEHFQPVLDWWKTGRKSPRTALIKRRSSPYSSSPRNWATTWTSAAIPMRKRRFWPPWI